MKKKRLILLILLLVGLVACETKGLLDEKVEMLPGVVEEVRVTAAAEGCKFFVRVDGVMLEYNVSRHKFRYSDCALLQKGDKVEIQKYWNQKYWNSDRKLEYRYKGDSEIVGEIRS